MMKKKYYFIASFIVFIVIYYLADYKRTFIHDESKNKSLTIWTRSNGSCYIIPGNYFLPYAPEENYILTSNKAYLYVVWNPNNIKKSIAIYIGSSIHEAKNLDKNITLFSAKNDFFMEYTGEYYDPTGQVIFNEDTIKYKKEKYQISFFDIACSSKVFGFFRCIDF